MRIIIIQDKEYNAQNWARWLCQETDATPVLVVGDTAKEIADRLRKVLAESQAPFEGTALDYIFVGSDAEELLSTMEAEEVQKMGKIVVFSQSDPQTIAPFVDKWRLIYGGGTNMENVTSQVRLHFGKK